jgi:hypothetical protein
MNNGIYVKIEDVLALIPDNDKLREQIAALPAIIISEMEDDTK